MTEDTPFRHRFGCNCPVLSVKLMIPAPSELASMNRQATHIGMSSRNSLSVGKTRSAGWYPAVTRL